MVGRPKGALKIFLEHSLASARQYCVIIKLPSFWFHQMEKVIIVSLLFLACGRYTMYELTLLYHCGLDLAKLGQF